MCFFSSFISIKETEKNYIWGRCMHWNPNCNTHPSLKPLGKKPCNSVQYNFLPVQRFKSITAVPYYRNHCHSLLNSHDFINYRVIYNGKMSGDLSSPLSIHGHFKLGCSEPCSLSFFVYQCTEFPQAAKPVSVLNYPQSWGLTLEPIRISYVAFFYPLPLFLLLYICKKNLDQPFLPLSSSSSQKSHCNQLLIKFTRASILFQKHLDVYKITILIT